MGIKLRIKADNEHEFRRMLTTLATPYLADLMAEIPDALPIEANAAPEPTPEVAKPKGGRPRGSLNKPKTNGAETQTQPEAQPPPPTPNGFLSLAEQIQIITDAAHDQPDRFKPLLVPLREQLGVQYISKAAEKDREVLQGFINEHGLAV